jgi:hypothetical protein
MIFRRLEQCCQYQIDDLVLGRQRLHRIAGAGDHTGPGGQSVIRATFFPPNFFEDNLDIVIVDSFINR